MIPLWRRQDRTIVFLSILLIWKLRNNDLKIISNVSGLINLEPVEFSTYGI